MADAEKIASTPSLKSSAMHENWQCFAVIDLERIELVNELASHDNMSLKACDNMECPVIQAITEFRRCSHCQQVCQKRDWRKENSDFSTRHLSLMRAIFDHDSVRLVDEERLSLRLARMREHAGPPITANATVDISNLEQERAKDKDREVCWAEQVARAARSRGRMHLMIFSDRDRMRRWMVPSCSDRSTLHEGMTRILHEVPRDSDGREEIEALLGATRRDREPNNDPPVMFQVGNTQRHNSCDVAIIFRILFNASIFGYIAVHSQLFPAP
ncbi:hypothetical protein B0H19DRAFT_1072634 [Mycena capillaripes]|nr:hypothetical protein B0H19DRAFT_1072634 [Mycena capillaripes]